MTYYSQHNQDQFLNEHIFNNKKEGVFLDIGAYDGIEGSNSYFFEKELGWKGICFEPIPKLYQRLKENRKCISINAAAWKEDTEKTFRLIEGYSEMLSGIVDCYDQKHINRIEQESREQNQKITDVPVKCLDINKILEQYGMYHIDFLSIDVEGSEFEILKHLNTDVFEIDYIVCENNYNDTSIVEMMKDKGYKRITRLNIDDVYVKDLSTRQNKFKIVIPSYNNSDWVETNIESILCQTYKNYEVLYINDASKDDTLTKVNNLVGNNPKWKVVSNEKNMRRGYNISPYNEDVIKFMSSDNDILTFIDGDDWLAYPNSLELLNNYYNLYNPWLTYGKFVCYTTLKEGTPQNTPYPNDVHVYNGYRQDHWRASHLRTFKWWLYKKIKKEDLLYSKTNQYYFHAEDLASTYPCLEMCPVNKIGVVPTVNYVFNDTPSNRERGVKREAAAGVDLELEIRKKVPYPKINLHTNNL